MQISSVHGRSTSFNSFPTALSIVTLMNPEHTGKAQRQSVKLPEDHLASIRLLESAYLANNDPIRQSGFGGGAKRWRAERSPLLEAIDADGDFLDLGCANAYLLESVVGWAQERGLTLNPHGVDLNPLLVKEAIRRFPDKAHHFWVANAWKWLPSKRFRWVYAIWDLVPIEMLPVLARHLLHYAVTDDGALIFGAYGSKSANSPSVDIARVLREGGLPVSGEASGGELPRGEPVTRFAWVKQRDWRQLVNEHP